MTTRQKKATMILDTEASDDFGYKEWNYTLPETLKKDSLITYKFKDAGVYSDDPDWDADYSINFSSSENYDWWDNNYCYFHYNATTKTITAGVDTRGLALVSSTPKLLWYENTISQIQVPGEVGNTIQETILEEALLPGESIIYTLSQTPKSNTSIIVSFYGSSGRKSYGFLAGVPQEYGVETLFVYDGDKTITITQEGSDYYRIYSVEYYPINLIYDVKDDTHNKELTWDWYKNDYHAGWVNRTGNQYMWFNILSNMNFTSGATYNEANMNALIQLQGKNNSNNIKNGVQLGPITYKNDGVWNNSMATLLTTTKIKSNGEEAKNYFNIFILQDDSFHYRVSDYMAFRRDVKTPSNKIITFGDMSKSIANNKPVSVPSGTNTTIIGKGPNVDPNDPNDIYITLTPGLWFVVGALAFAANTTGVRTIKISDVKNDTGNPSSIKVIKPVSVSTWINRLSTSQFYYVPKGTTKNIYLIAWQNSGSALSTAGMIQAVLV